jgi:hypothetical protein
MIALQALGSPGKEYVCRITGRNHMRIQGLPFHATIASEACSKNVRGQERRAVTKCTEVKENYDEQGSTDRMMNGHESFSLISYSSPAN